MRFQDMEKIEISKLSRPQFEAALRKLIDIRGNDDGIKAIVALAHRCALRVLPKLGVMPLSINWPDRPYWQLLCVMRANIAIHQWLTVGMDDKTLNDYQEHVSFTASVAKEDYAAQCAAYVIKAATALDNACVNYARAVFEYARDGYFEGASGAEEDYCQLINPKTNVVDVLVSPLWGKNKPPQFEAHLTKLNQELKSNELTMIGGDIDSLLAGEFEAEFAQKYFTNISPTELRSAKALLALMTKQELIDDNCAARVLIVGPGGAGENIFSGAN